MRGVFSQGEFNRLQLSSFAGDAVYSDSALRPELKDCVSTRQELVVALEEFGPSRWVRHVLHHIRVVKHLFLQPERVLRDVVVLGEGLMEFREKSCSE